MLPRTAGATAEGIAFPTLSFWKKKSSGCCMRNRCREGGVARANVGKLWEEYRGGLMNHKGSNVDGQSGERETHIGKETTELVNG